MANSLFVAISNNDAEAVKCLVESGVDVNHCRKNVSPLSFAVSKKKPQMVELLIKLGANVNGCEGKPAIHMAVDENSPDLARLLLKLGADAKSVCDGKSLIQHALERENKQLTCLVLSFAGDLDNFNIYHSLCHNGRWVEKTRCKNIMLSHVLVLKSTGKFVIPGNSLWLEKELDLRNTSWREEVAKLKAHKVHPDYELTFHDVLAKSFAQLASTFCNDLLRNKMALQRLPDKIHMHFDLISFRVKEAIKLYDCTYGFYRRVMSPALLDDVIFNIFEFCEYRHDEDIYVKNIEFKDVRLSAGESKHRFSKTLLSCVKK